MQRIALILGYDGSRFDGWQTQPSGRGVQDALEHSLGALANHPIRVVCAGRTDAGVHALAQVVHFDTEAHRPLSAWVRGVNARLPAGVAVREALAVDPLFHARFGARRRHYAYLLHCAPVRHPLLLDRVGWVHRRVDETAMRAAAQCLLGEHDFSAFRASQCQARSPVRRLEQLTIERDGQLLLLRLSANAFLHHMVRNIVGALVDVGCGRQPVAWMAHLLASRRRSLGAATFSPAGLYLSHVDYDPCFGVRPAGGLADLSAVLAFARMVVDSR